MRDFIDVACSFVLGHYNFLYGVHSRNKIRSPIFSGCTKYFLCVFPALGGGREFPIEFQFSSHFVFTKPGHEKMGSDWVPQIFVPDILCQTTRHNNSFRSPFEVDFLSIFGQK